MTFKVTVWVVTPGAKVRVPVNALVPAVTSLPAKPTLAVPLTLV